MNMDTTRDYCPHCGRELEGDELATGLCTSEYCPRHDCHECDCTGMREPPATLTKRVSE